MKVLLDHDLPKQLRLLLRGHLALTARQMLWDELSNGRLIAVAQAQGFDILLTADKRMFQQQQHVERKISIILLSTPLMVHLQPQVGLISDAIERGTPGSFESITIPESTHSKRYSKPSKFS
jgi:predicted nuclease of predicted toxin-antitoxin system